MIHSTCKQNLATRFSRSGDMIAGMASENGSCDTDHASFRDGLASVIYDLIPSTCVQNLSILA